MSIRHQLLGRVPTRAERVFTLLSGPDHGGEACCVYENTLVPGARIPLHTHEVEEVIVCLLGRAECSLDGGAPEPFEEGSVLVIPPRVPHTITNTGSGYQRQIAILAGPDPGTRWLEPQGSVE